MTSALVVLALVFGGAAASLVTGVFLLAGLPWALIATGLLLFGAGIQLQSGLKNG